MFECETVATNNATPSTKTIPKSVEAIVFDNRKCSTVVYKISLIIAGITLPLL